MRLTQLLLCLSAIPVLAPTAEACRLFRGGCSDPCSVGACATRSGCTSCGTAQSAAPVVYGSAHYANRGSACQACGSSQAAYSAAAYAPQSTARVVQTNQSQIVDCGPVTTYQVVLQPEYFTETRPQAVTEYEEETRYRTRTIARQVPVEIQDYRTTTSMVTKEESKTVEYQVLVPKTGEREVNVTESVPVWNEVSEDYVVQVPTVVDVEEQYTVKVAKLTDQPFTYQVYVPQVQKEQKIQRVTNVVPVTKTRTVQITRPVTRYETRTRDAGHWEVRVEQIGVATVATSNSYATSSSSGVVMGGCGTAVSSVSMGGCQPCATSYAPSRCGCNRGCASRCSGCGSSACSHSGCSNGCGSSNIAYASGSCGANVVHSNACGSVPSMATHQVPQTVTRRVWVPNVVTEQVPVTENVVESQEIAYTAFEQTVEEVPYERTYMVYVPEQRTGTRQVVSYVPETRTRTRKIVQYKEETRTRVRKELSYETKTRVEKVPFVKYVSEPRTKEVKYSISVPETKVEPYTRTEYQTIQEEVSEPYTVKVPVTTYKEVQVQVSRMVPKIVPVTIYPCSQTGATSLQGSTLHSATGCNTCATSSATTSGGCASCATAPASCPTCR